MKEQCDEFFTLVKKSIERDPWVEDRKLAGYCDEIVGEVNEMMQALEKKDYQNLKEELGDILFDLAHVCFLAEKEGLFTMQEVFETINQKIKRRKPYLLTAEHQPITKEEARRIWLEVKAKEKEMKK